MTRLARKRIIKKATGLREDKKNVPVPTAAYPMLVHKLREISFGIRGGDNWIRSVSDKHLLDLFDLIKEDLPADVIVMQARAKWNYPVSISCTADLAAVKLFKSKTLATTVHGLNPVSTEEKTIRKHFMTRARSLLNQLDPIGELVAVVQEQKRRVQMGLDQEVVDEKINPSVSAEISQLNRMLHELVDKFQRMGLIEEKPIEQVLHLNGTFNSVIDLISKTGSQDKMIGIANEFLANIEDSVVELKVNKDGVFEENTED